MRYDVIVIGAGHNGMTTACLLAGEGRSVVVVERRDVVGGLCAGEEFHPGYRTPGLLHDTATIRQSVVSALKLEAHGLKLEDAPQSVFVPQRDGQGLLLHHDLAQASDEIGRHSAKDSKRYGEYRSFIKKMRRVVEPMLNETPPDIFQMNASGMMGLARHGLAARRLGSRDMMELLRIPPMRVADWMREWFETELLCTLMAAPATLGTWTGPWSPGTAGNLLVRECTAARVVRGGPAQLSIALERAAGELGVTIRTGVAVQSIRVEKGQVNGVVLEGGEDMDSRVVASSCDPHTTFLHLVKPGDIPHRCETNVRFYRQRGTTAKVHLALDKPFRFNCRSELEVEYATTGETLDDQERAFDAVKYRRFSDRPILDIHVPSVSQPDAAPAGHSSVSIIVSFAPYELDGGWTDAARDELRNRVMTELELYVTGITSSVVASEVLTPVDIEERYGIRGGQIHHGEPGLDQLITRPTIETSRYSTPIDGLFICGSGSHPGGGVTCAPGALAAREIRRAL